MYGVQELYGKTDSDCVVCLSTHANTVLKPCNHICLCSECADVIRKNGTVCPMCRSCIVPFCNRVAVESFNILHTETH